MQLLTLYSFSYSLGCFLVSRSFSDFCLSRSDNSWTQKKLVPQTTYSSRVSQINLYWSWNTRECQRGQGDIKPNQSSKYKGEDKVHVLLSGKDQFKGLVWFSRGTCLSYFMRLCLQHQVLNGKVMMYLCVLQTARREKYIRRYVSKFEQHLQNE